MSKKIVKVSEYTMPANQGREETPCMKFFLRDTGSGQCNTISLSLKRLEGYTPRVGDVVDVFYNAYERVDCILPVDNYTR